VKEAAVGVRATPVRIIWRKRRSHSISRKAPKRRYLKNRRNLRLKLKHLQKSKDDFNLLLNREEKPAPPKKEVKP